MTKQNSPAEQMEAILNFVDACSRTYKAAQAGVSDEDKRLMDLVHEMEFAGDKAARNRVATKMQRSRKARRKCKDEVQRNELIVKFFGEQNHKNTLNKMRQLLGQQRRQEDYLNGERVYKPRMEGK